MCDICGEKLDKASKAAAVFQNFSPDGSRLRLLHVHKGSIDGHTCHAEAEALLRQNGQLVGWKELKEFLVDLAANADFPASDMAEYDARRQRFE